MRKKALLSLLAMVIMTAGVLTSCSDVYTEGDWYVCVVNSLTGKVTKEIPPGTENGYDLGKNEVAYKVPTSQRFHAISVDRTKADDGANAWLQTPSKGLKLVRTNYQARFFFRQDRICDFVLRHVKRNLPDGETDFEFNKRPNDTNHYNSKTGLPKHRANARWVQWLNENFTPAAQRTLQPLTQATGWEHLEFNLPINAGSDGVVPDGDVGLLTWSDLEQKWDDLFTAELGAKVGDYFCGIGYNPAKPDECPPITMDIAKIWLVDREPVKALQELDRKRDEQNNAAEEGRIAAATLDQKKADEAIQAELRDLEVREAEAAARVQDAQNQREQKRKQAEIVAKDPELQKCLVLIEKVGTCPMLEESKARAAGNVSVSVGQPGG